MLQVPIIAAPNQSFSVRLGDLNYDITIKETRGVMCASITRDNVLIVENIRILPGRPIIPYLYKEDGNFAVYTTDDEYPYYTEFGNTQFLYYVDAAELEAIRAGA
jgi:hypothetical protein